MNRNLTIFLVLLVLINIITTSSVKASQELYYTNLSEYIISSNNYTKPKKESKISEILHKCPIISKFFNRTVNIDYVAEDNMLTEYMLGNINQYDNESCILVTYYD